MGKIIAAVVQGAISALLAPLQAWMDRQRAKKEGQVELREGDEHAQLQELSQVGAPIAPAESDSLWERNKAKFGPAAPSAEH